MRTGSTVKTILDKINGNMVNYDILRNDIIGNKEECDISVIVPVRGRKQFVGPLIRSLKETEKEDNDIVITIVEHSERSEMGFVTDHGVSHIHIACGRDDPFNKCLAMNVGALFSAKAQYFLFHDVDLIVRSDFFLNIDKNVEKKKCKAIQTFDKRRVLNCPSMLTEDIIKDKVNFDDFKEGWRGIYDHGRYGAPGGSIMVDKDTFFRVGGYDPELWHSFSPEDLFFWDKVSIFTKMEICDNPVNDIYHLHHPLQQHTNPDFKDMMALYKRWYHLDKACKKEICDYKCKIIGKYAY